MCLQYQHKKHNHHHSPCHQHGVSSGRSAVISAARCSLEPAVVLVVAIAFVVVVAIAVARIEGSDINGTVPGVTVVVVGTGTF